MKNLFIKSLLISSAFLVACGDDDTSPSGAFSSGVLIVNEGNFTEEDGSISFYDGESVSQGAFQTVNDLPTLGSVVQSMTVSDDYAYIVVNNSNKVEVVERYTFESVTTIDAALPRYMVISEGIGYLTEWVSFGSAGQVSRIDLSTNTVIGTIEVGFLPEDIEIVNGSLYVTEAFGSSLYEVDLSTETVTTYELTNGSEQIVTDANSNLWIACEGGSDENFAPLNNGSLVQFNTTTKTITQTFELNVNYQGKLAIDVSGNTIVIPVNSDVFSFEIDATSFPSSPVISDENMTSIYGVGVDPESGDIYLGDSKNFLDDGEVFIYNQSGTFKTSFGVGRAPNGFVFN